MRLCGPPAPALNGFLTEPSLGLPSRRQTKPFPTAGLTTVGAPEGWSPKSRNPAFAALVPYLLIQLRSPWTCCQPSSAKPRAFRERSSPAFRERVISPSELFGACGDRTRRGLFLGIRNPTHSIPQAVSRSGRWPPLGLELVENQGAGDKSFGCERGPNSHPKYEVS